MLRQIEWPLVGRDEELAVIAELIAGAERQGLVMAGAAGTGKSRLAVEALAIARLATRAPGRLRPSGLSDPYPLSATGHDNRTALSMS